MKLSILLPTRNGGRFLRDCVASVLGQDDPDLELVVADNANRDETQDVLQSFRPDSRMLVLRHEEPMPVTDNWLSALRASSGDYVLMLGDDDYLLPSYVRRVRSLLDEHKDLDCIVYNAYRYVFPSAIAGLGKSHYADPHFTFGPEFSSYRLLGRELQAEIVRDMFRFRPRIPLNMQTTLVSRRAADRLPYGLFRPPFPDHYALNALLLTADRWLYAPERLLAIGVTVKSFGHFVYSNEEDEGLRYLGISTGFDGKLPGNELLNGMYMWLLRLKHDFPTELGGVEVSRPHYVVRQLWAWYLQSRFGPLSVREAVSLLRLLSLSDVVALASLVRDKSVSAEIRKRLRANRRDGVELRWKGLKPLPGDVGNIAEFVEWLRKESLLDATATG